MIHPATASYVRSANCIDTDINLGFSITLRKSLVLRGIGLGLFDTDELRESAKHCLIVLIGSKKVWVNVDDPVHDNMHVADMYVNSLKFSPVGYDTIEGQLMVNVSTFMKWLLKDGLDHKKVLGAINGQTQNPRAR